MVGKMTNKRNLLNFLLPPGGGPPCPGPGPAGMGAPAAGEGCGRGGGGRTARPAGGALGRDTAPVRTGRGGAEGGRTWRAGRGAPACGPAGRCAGRGCAAWRGVARSAEAAGSMARLLGTLRSSQPVARFQRCCGLFPAGEEGGGDPAEGVRDRAACNGAAAPRRPAAAGRGPSNGVRSGRGPQVSAAGGGRPGPAVTQQSRLPPPRPCAPGLSPGGSPRIPPPARAGVWGPGCEGAPGPGSAVRCRSPASCRPPSGEAFLGFSPRPPPSLAPAKRDNGGAGRCLPAEVPRPGMRAVPQAAAGKAVPFTVAAPVAGLR